MTNELLKEIKLAKEEIDSLPLVIEFKNVREAFYKNEELKHLQNKVKYLKKCSMSDEELEEYTLVKEKILNNPLNANFKTLSKDIFDLKLEIKQILKL